MSASFREAKREDVEELYKLIVESTRGLTKLTIDRLRDCMFHANSNSPVEVLVEDPEIEFDMDQLQSNAPVARAVVAEVDDLIVGYLIFHDHYTPWIGQIGSIDDIFTKPSMRRKGIGRGLVQKATQIARADGLKKFLFSVDRMSTEMRQYLEEEGKSYWYRTDETDWSVLRINFNRSGRHVTDVQRGY